jgi:nucleotide-binding universal stress UspA family protein
MYRKILITTDGSTVSKHTACAGVRFAQQLGADVLLLFVAPAYQFPVYVEIVPPAYPSEDDYAQAMRRVGADHLRALEERAGACGLRWESLTELSDTPALKIVAVADAHACDLIFIGSHGRSGWGQVLLGSVTNKVLSHTSKPVLVHRLLQEPVD